ncbi:UDP-N-acetylmuramoylalanine--D-glutamate ligase [Arthrobacter sp. Hiyo8]|nr:UDP-N-acetylmuramoylalanine--D-glutamate ligase [Arthrobacter sp. Hiyo8]
MSASPQTKPSANDRLKDLVSWDSDWKGLRVVVTGIGVSGFAAADTLIELGARVVVVDAATSAKALAQADTLKIVGAADVLLGQDAVKTLPRVDGEKAELVVTSPGWRPDQSLLAAAKRAHVPVWATSNSLGGCANARAARRRTGSPSRVRTARPPRWA